MPRSIILLIIILLVIIFGSVYIWRFTQDKPQPISDIQPISTITPQPSPNVTLSNTPNINGLVSPIAEFKQRVTKKFYGTYITPQNSPVTPERFTGYHTGVDVEYTDITADIPVFAIAGGTVMSSGYGSGYGGVMVVKHTIDTQTLYVTYGHLRQSSMLKMGSSVKQGEQVGVLGTGYSKETDGERRHLHFGISKTNTSRGYVSSLAEVHSNWIDPLSLYP